MNVTLDMIEVGDIDDVNRVMGTAYAEATLLRRSRRGTFPPAAKVGHSPAIWNLAHVRRWCDAKFGPLLRGAE